MAYSGRAAHRPTAVSTVVGLLLFALVLIASAPAWYGSDPAQRSVSVASELWAPGAWVEESSTMPSTSAGTTAHLPGRVPLASAPAVDRADEGSVPRTSWRDPNADFSPQESAHRPADSRSPPLA
ncbi:hypothetical protein [Sphaerisporangium fuscum]|uniref:hypothetical protein n=1 Tax=Sphaerisporangium fuscum TaxID=2835868 RepID=UPI001BDC5BD6|nr:hypothetical protein [Sphaerisporangium fuscum]